MWFEPKPCLVSPSCFNILFVNNLRCPPFYRALHQIDFSMKKYLTATLFLFIIYAAQAQQSQTYQRAIGIKFPAGVAITYKQFLSEYNNVEAEAMFWSNGFRAGRLACTNLILIYKALTACAGM